MNISFYYDESVRFFFTIFPLHPTGTSESYPALFVMNGNSGYVLQSKHEGAHPMNYNNIIDGFSEALRPDYSCSWQLNLLTREHGKIYLNDLLYFFPEAISSITYTDSEGNIAREEIVPPAIDTLNDYVPGTTPRDYTADSSNSTTTTSPRETQTHREPRIQFISANYSQNTIYTDRFGWHHSHGVPDWYNGDYHDAPYRIGIELETIANNEEEFNRLKRMQSNVVFMERDGSLEENGVDHGLEFISIPLNPKDIKDPNFWNPFIDVLKTKAKSWTSSKCGLHIHIGREILGNDSKTRKENLGKILFFYYYILKGSEINTFINGRSSGYHDNSSWKCEEIEGLLSLGMKYLRHIEVKDKVSDIIRNRILDSRYYDVNITNEHTIEFRLGKGSINTNRIIGLVTYYEMMCKYVSEVDRWEHLSEAGFIKYIHKHVTKENPIFKFLKLERNDD